MMFRKVKYITVTDNWHPNFNDNQVKINGQWETNETVIPMKKCDLSDFGSNFQNIFSKTDLS